jgi:hypothetical protein
MLGQLLRSLENSPDQSSPYVVDAINSLPGRTGRHRVNWLQVFKKKTSNIPSTKILLLTRELARDHNAWKKTYLPEMTKAINFWTYNEIKVPFPNGHGQNYHFCHDQNAIFII